MKIEFENASGELLAGRLELPDGDARAFALFAHCFTCSKDVAAASRISRALAQRGFGVLRFDFTGLGNSEGDFANTDFSSNVADLRRAAGWLEEHHQAPALLVGHSLGGAAVLAAAFDLPAVRAVATIGAPSDPQHVERLLRDDVGRIEREGEALVELGGRRFPIRKEFLRDLDRQNLLDRLKDLDKAVLVMHSPIDAVVGIDHARRLYEALRHPKSFVSLDDADHLLSRRADARYVADVLAAWASRYVDGETAAADDAALPPREALVTERDPDAFEQSVRIGRHVLVADEPESSGGHDRGPDPYGFLLAALGTCTSMTLRMYARHKGWPLEHVAVHLRHEKVHAKDCEDCESKDGKVDQIHREIRIVGDDLDDEQRARLLEIADRCPVHRTLGSETKVRTTAAPPAGADG